MSIAELQRVKALEAKNLLLEARLEKIEAYLWGEEVNDDLETLTHGAVPERKRGRPRKDAA
jgi:hypothetical protein